MECHHATRPQTGKKKTKFFPEQIIHLMALILPLKLKSTSLLHTVGCCHIFLTDYFFISFLSIPHWGKLTVTQDCCTVRLSHVVVEILLTHHFFCKKNIYIINKRKCFTQRKQTVKRDEGRTGDGGVGGCSYCAFRPHSGTFSCLTQCRPHRNTIGQLEEEVQCFPKKKNPCSHN